LFFLNNIAFVSACGLPPIPVHPADIKLLFLVITQPTEGLFLVFPRFFLAWFKANDIKYDLLLILF